MKTFKIVGDCEKCRGMCLLDWEEDWMEGRFLRVQVCVNCGWRTPFAKDRQLVTQSYTS